MQRCVGAGDGTNYTALAQLGADVVTFSDQRLTASKTYYYRVCAFNSAGSSAYAPPASATTLAAPPMPPTSLAATAAAGGKSTVSWRDNSNNESGFRLQRASDAAFTIDLVNLSIRANSTKYNDSRLTPGATYYYRIQSYNAAGYSGYSGTVSIVALP